MCHLPEKGRKEIEEIVKEMKERDTEIFFFYCVGINDMSTFVGHFCCLPEKGRREIEEIVEEMKAKDRGERGTGMKVKKRKK